MARQLTMSCPSDGGPHVRRSRAWALIIATLASVSASVGSAGRGGRTALNVSGGITVASDGGGPGAALDNAAAGHAEDASSVATIGAGDLATCTTPGIYLVMGPGDFYTFPPEPADAASAMQTDIVRLHPGANTRETVATVGGVVVAALSSPCAPTH